MKKTLIISIAMMALAITACKKESDPDPQGNATYAVKTDGATRFDVNYGDKNTVGIYVASANGYVDPNNLTITLKADSSLVAEYNKTRKDTVALMLPAKAYSFKETSVIIYKNNKKSIGTEIKIEVQYDMPDTLYVLPVTIASISGSSTASIDPNATVYFVINKKYSAVDKGKGTKAEPYLIYEKKDLMGMKSKMKPVSEAEDSCIYFKMMMDVDLGMSKETSEIEDWEPLNYDGSTSTAPRFPYDLKIDFNGNGHIIKNLVSNGWTYASMFGVLYGSVYDLTFENAYIEGEYAIGVVGGYAGTEVAIGGATTKTPLVAYIKNVKVNNSTVNNVSGNKHGVGGIVGRISTNSIIENTSFNGRVEATKNYAGGIAGYDTGTSTIRNCSTSGVLVSKAQRNGGIFGGIIKANTKVENCFTTMGISARLCGGGIVGHANLDKGDEQHPANVISKCIVWCDSLTARNSLENSYSTGAVVGFCSPWNTCQDCWYRDGLTVIAKTDAASTYFALVDQPNSSEVSPQQVGIDCDWTISDPNQREHNKTPYNGKKASSGANPCDIATQLGWDTAIWDLTGTIPVLK